MAGGQLYGLRKRLEIFGLIGLILQILRRIKVGHWAKYSDVMATYTGTTTGSFQAMTGSPYSPLTGGRLKKLILIIGGSAATALVDGTVTVKAESVSFGGVPVIISNAGAGLQTAPAHPPMAFELDCDVAVKTGVTVNMTILLDTGSTPVTPRIRVIGVFEG